MNGLYCIQAQAVHVVLAHPVKRVLYKIAAHTFTTGLIVIDCFAPGRLVFISEVRAEEAQVISFVAQVVVNHV